MSGREKSTSDDDFGVKLSAATASRQGDGLTAAERAATRELIGLIEPLRVIVADYKFRGEAWKRAAVTATLIKAWATWLTAFAGVVTLGAAAFKYLAH